jgi:hypothetical protein
MRVTGEALMRVTGEALMRVTQDPVRQAPVVSFSGREGAGCHGLGMVCGMYSGMVCGMYSGMV